MALGASALHGQPHFSSDVCPSSEPSAFQAILSKEALGYQCPATGAMAKPFLLKKKGHGSWGHKQNKTKTPNETKTTMKKKTFLG